MGENSHSLTIISEICGWAYFTSWSISFYGQIWELWKLQNAEGIILDYVIFNVTGYIFYGIYNTYGIFGNPQETGLKNVDIQDLLFTYHGFLMMLIIIAQCTYYPRGKNKMSKFCKILSITLWVFILLYCFFTNIVHVFNPPLDLNTIHFLGYLKLCITLVKYFPQALWNYKRKSTKGWNICNVICDFAGGALSFLQNIFDSINGQGGNIFGGVNTAKFFLGAITMIFDTIFIIQHYFLYKSNNNTYIKLEISQTNNSKQKEYGSKMSNFEVESQVKSSKKSSKKQSKLTENQTLDELFKKTNSVLLKK